MNELLIDNGSFAALHGKCVVLTGGSSGIGLATVELLLSLGVKVVVGDQNAMPISHSNLIYHKTDVTSWSSLLSLFKAARSLYHRIDHVFANAGIAGRTDYLHDSYDETTGELKEPSSLTIDINFRGMLNTAYLGLHHMRHQNPPGGSIICTASASSFQRFRVPDYTCAKHAVLGFMRGMVPLLKAQEVPVRINCISPSWTRTGIVPAALVERCGLRDQGPEVVARSVALLMADEARQGQLIYSVEGRYYEIEETVLLPAARHICGSKDEDAVMASIHREYARAGEAS